MFWSGKQRLWLCAGLALLQALLLSSSYCVALGTVPDEGTIALQAMRVAQGQFPHRDYFLQTPVGGDLWVGAWFYLFGPYLESLRAYFLIEMALLAAGIQFFCSRWLPKGWSELPALFFLSHGAFGWIIPSPRWDAALFLILALGCVGRGRRCLVAGVLVGLAALTQHPAGAAGAAGIFLGLLLQKERHWPSLRLFLAGILLIWLPFLLFLGRQGIMPRFLYDILFFNLSNYVETQQTGVAWGSFAENFGAAGASFSQGFLLGFRNLCYAYVDLLTYGGWFLVSALGLLVALRRRDRDSLCLSLTVVFLTLLELVRPNRYHFYFHTPLVLPLLVGLLARNRPGRLVCLSLLGAHLCLAVSHVQDNRAARYPVPTPVGVLYVHQPERAAIYRDLMQYNSELPEHEKLFVFPDEPLLQWLTGRGPCTREVAAFPLFYTLDQFRAIHQALAEEPVENLAYVPFHVDLGAYPKISLQAAERELEWLHQYFTEDYVLVRSIAGIQFYRRKKI